MKVKKLSAVTIFFITFLMVTAYSQTSFATLVDRGGGLIYDSEYDITYLQDIEWAYTSGYDSDGIMTWYDAMDWVENLEYYDSVRGVIWDDWRLPTAIDADGTVNMTKKPRTDEIGHIFYYNEHKKQFDRQDYDQQPQDKVRYHKSQ